MADDTRPHSRACGWRGHPHGSACSTNCPTCHGVDERTLADICKPLMDLLAAEELHTAFVIDTARMVIAEYDVSVDPMLVVPDFATTIATLRRALEQYDRNRP